MKLPFRTKARTKHAESRVSEHDDATHAPAGGDSNATPTMQEHLEQHHEDHLKKQRPITREQPETAAAEHATRREAQHDVVAATARDENAGPDEGRGTRPAAVALLWTDAFGRTSLRALQSLILLVLASLVIFGLVKVSIVVIPVLLALIVASSTWPIIRFLTRRKWPNVLAAVTVLLSVVVLLGGAITLVVLAVEQQWADLSKKANEGVIALISWVQSQFGVVIDEAQVNAWIEQVKGLVFTKEAGASAAHGVSAGLSVAGDLATSLVLFLVVLFFFMKDGPQMWNFLIGRSVGPQRERLQLVGRRAVAVMGGYVRGTATVALVDAVFIGIGLAIVGVPLAFPLAVVVFICAFIPVVGAVLAGVIAALVTLVTNGPVEAMIVVGIVIAVNQLEGNFLAPVLLGRSLKLHELVVLLALTVGTVLGGIIGTLLSVPLTAVAWAVIQGWNEPLPTLERETVEEETHGA